MVLLSAVSFTTIHLLTMDKVAVSKVSSKDESKDKIKATKKDSVKAATDFDDKDMVPLKDFCYKMSSEKKAYPDLTKHPDAFIDVDISNQRVYIKDGKTVLYEMYASTGKDDATPRGTYQIEPERGEYFYTAPLKLGAYHYTSFLNHGEYLFHTTPTDEKGHYVESIAKTLGVKPSSHGCVHLSNPDCKWIFDNAPTGMKVVIHGHFSAN